MAFKSGVLGVYGGYIVAINGYNGKLIWKSKKFGSSVAKRGLVFWKGNDNERPRIIFSNRERLISLDIQNGKKDYKTLKLERK